LFCFADAAPPVTQRAIHPRFKTIQCTQGMLDGLPINLKEAGLAEDAGMIVLRERHKGNTWKAADTIVNLLFKAIDTENKGYILKCDFKEFFMHRLHPDLERHVSHHTNSTASHRTHTSTRRTTWDFNAVLQRARLKRAERLERERSRRGGSSGGCFVAETRVMMAGGRDTSIDRIECGDEVVVFDSKGMLKTAKVQQTRNYWPSDQDLLEITLSSGRTVRCTKSHPFAVSPDTFVPAAQLAEGHRVMTHPRDGGRLECATVVQVRSVDGQRVYNLNTVPHNTFFANDIAVHNKGGGGGGGCFSGDVTVTVMKKNSLGFVDYRRVSMRQLKAGDEIKGSFTTRSTLLFSLPTKYAGSGRVLAAITFLRSNAAPLYRYQGRQ
jgi:hypothetical protein